MLFMTDDRERLWAAHKRWLDDVIAQTGVPGTRWADAAGLTATTVTRRVNPKKDADKAPLKQETITKLARAAGVSEPSFKDFEYESGSLDFIAGQMSLESAGLPKSTPLDGMTVIPEYDIKVSAGGGVYIDKEDIKSEWSVPTSLIRNELRRNPNTLSMVEVTGDSMEPKLLPGDRILVDHSDVNPSPPGVFALWDGYGLVVKNIHRVHGSDPEKITCISTNGVYPPYEAFLDDVHIVGRVVWFSRRM